MRATSDVVPVVCDDCGADLIYEVVTDGDRRHCVLRCRPCKRVLYDAQQRLVVLHGWVSDEYATIGRYWGPVDVGPASPVFT